MPVEFMEVRATSVTIRHVTEGSLLPGLVSAALPLRGQPPFEQIGRHHSKNCLTDGRTTQIRHRAIGRHIHARRGRGQEAVGTISASHVGYPGEQLRRVVSRRRGRVFFRPAGHRLAEAGAHRKIFAPGVKQALAWPGGANNYGRSQSVRLPMNP